ncbi:MULTISPECIES: ABC transporter permease [unclassified Pyramidobacter]|uniref:ABC transporter permease n=1 Tax=unclassified Pyramidobacter TaxID=2632171 RepID=UPI000EA0BF50|nr:MULTISPECIES: ABC transporter permease [unclassified Pyramidobacter]MDY3213067.1 ABC transporter permease [Pyramidobacter sp.]RKJ79242.1 ABC transporter permease [Pyramidobacter sp. CG50-2]WOL40463.1 ABC transporter permease [Pyramidobacter sp. YE332]
MSGIENKTAAFEDLAGLEEISISSRGQLKDICRRFLKNRAAVLGLVIIVILVVCALFPGQISGFDYARPNLRMRYLPLSAEHWMGTDELGRDIFTRVIWGCRTSLTIGLSSVVIACVIGTAVGCVAGFYGGWLDNVLMRCIDVLLAVPNLLLGISIVAALGNSIPNLILAIGLGLMSSFARVTRSAVITVRGEQYIEAARSTGASNLRIIWKYVLPNAMAPIIVQVSMGIATAILTISGLSFIGLGVPAPTPEWGGMLSTGRQFIRDHWNLITFPGVAIMITVFAFNLFGDGLRDALDPRLKS